MSDEPVDVVIDVDRKSVTVGRLWSRAKRQEESASFRYDETYLTSPGAFPIDPALPLGPGVYPTLPGQGLFNVFADTAPDRWGRNLMLRENRRVAAAEGRTARRLFSVDFMLGVSDQLRQGSVRFRMGGEYLSGSTSAVPRLVSLPQLLRAADAVDDGDDLPDQDLRDLLAAGASLGGARPKAAVVDGAGRLSIAKFPKREGTDKWDVIGWEATALDMAAAAGINSASSELIRIGGRHTLVLPRFDRDDRDGRLFYCSALTAVESSDGEERSYLEILDWMDTVGMADPESDARELWRRIAYSVVIGNTDDHLRNHGFLRSGDGTWSLAPAFDINPTPGADPKFQATAIDLDNRESSLDVALSVASEFRLSLGEAKAEIAAIGSVVTQWERFARRNGLRQRDLDVMSDALSIGAESAARSSRPVFAVEEMSFGPQPRDAHGRFGRKPGLR